MGSSIACALVTWKTLGSAPARWYEKPDCLEDGKTEVRLSSSTADIAATTHVYEVERVNYWKHRIEQVMRYAEDTGPKPALALFGHALTPIAMAKIKRKAARPGIDFLLKLWE